MWGLAREGTLGSGAVYVRPVVGMGDLGTLASDARCVMPTVVVGGVGTLGSGVVVVNFVLCAVSWLKMLLSMWVAFIWEYPGAL